MTTHIFCRLNFAFTLALAAALHWIVALPLARGADLTADQIMERSKEAMKPPIHYQMTSQGAKSEVFQKVLSHGGLATRFETSLPKPRISLTLGKSSYEFYPNHGVGIDTSFKLQSITDRAALTAESLGSKLSRPTEVKQVVSKDGRNCFEITAVFPSDLLTAMRNTGTGATRGNTETNIPREKRTLIDKNTFVMVETRVVSQSGATIFASEYRNVQHPTDLRDDMFLPPDGIELWKPKNKQEYSNLVKELFDHRSEALARMREAAEARRKPVLAALPHGGRPEIDVQTGRIHRPSFTSTNRGPIDRLSPAARARTGRLTAVEILQRSQDAMRAPIRYRVIRDGVSTVVSQLGFFDGTTATRLEMSSPERKISLLLDNVSCEFYPDRGLGIDTSLLERPARGESAILYGVPDENMAGAAQVREFVSEDGRDCLEIIATYTGNSSRAVVNPPQAKAKMPMDSMSPRESRIVIDKKTFVVVTTRLVSHEGATISLCEYRDIEHPTDLRLDLFLPPDGIEFLQPRERQEYDNILNKPRQSQSHKSANAYEPGPNLRQTSSTAPGLIKSSEIESDPGAATSVRPTASRDEFERRIAAKVADARVALADGQPRSESGILSGKNWVFAILSLTLVAASVTFVARRRLASFGLNARRSRSSLRIR
jgi:hypothetical protein